MAKLNPEKFKLKDGREVTFRSPEPDEWYKIRDYIKLIKTESQNTNQFPDQPELEEKTTRERIHNANESKKKMMVNAILEDRFIAQMDFGPVHMIEDHPWLKHNTYFGMAIVQEFWGQGLAKKILEILEREAKKIGYTHIRAEVRDHNDRGIQLYTNFGFEITGTKKKYTFIDGKYHDDFVISKEIL